MTTDPEDHGSLTPEGQHAILIAAAEGLSEAVNRAGRTLAGLLPLRWYVDTFDSAALVGQVPSDYPEQRAQEVAEQWAQALDLHEIPARSDGTRTWQGNPHGADAHRTFDKVEVWCIADDAKWQAATTATEQWASEQRVQGEANGS